MAAPAAPASLPIVQAPAAWSAIDFISDLHLSEDTPRTFEAFGAYLRETPADAVFILGDLVEVWVGDDARHAGFEALCAELLTAAAARRTLAFMAGNRDFLVGSEMLQACGVMRLDDPSVLLAFGGRALLSHGDALCLSDVEYQAFRAQVRSADWQRQFLGQPLTERRELARAMRAESERRKRSQPVDQWFDVDPSAAIAWMRAAAASTLVHGHTHRPASQTLAPGFVRHVLSDWDLDHAGAGPLRADVLRWTKHGFERIRPASVRPAP